MGYPVLIARCRDCGVIQQNPRTKYCENYNCITGEIQLIAVDYVNCNIPIPHAHRKCLRLRTALVLTEVYREEAEQLEKELEEELQLAPDKTIYTL